MTGRSRFRFRFRGVMSLVKSIASQFFDILQKEEASSNTNVFYDPADLSSLFDGRKAEAQSTTIEGNPSVGDVVGTMMDTSQMGGKTADEYIAENAISVTGLAQGALNLGNFTQDFSDSLASSFSVGDYIVIKFTISNYTSGTLQVGTGNQNTTTNRAFNNISGNGTFYKLWKATAVNIAHRTADSGFVGTFNIDVVAKIPGHHAIAPDDNARPVLFDDPDLTAAALTDNGQRGEELATDILTWTEQSFSTSPKQADGSILIDAAVDGSGQIFQDTGTLEPGAFYEVSFDFVNNISAGTLVLYATAIGLPYTVLDDKSTGQVTLTLQADDAQAPFGINSNISSGSARVSNISVRKVLTAFDERGAELVPDSGFNDAAQWDGTSGVVSGGEAYFTAGNSRIDAVGGNLVSAGLTYEVVFTVAEVTSGSVYFNFSGASPTNGTVRTSAGTYTETVTPSEDGEITLRTTGGTTDLKVSYFSVKKVIYPNLVTNGTFDTDSDWTKGTGWSIGSGVASASSATGNLQQTGVATANKWYKIQFYISAYTSGTITPNIGGTSGASYNSTGWKSDILRANGTPVNFIASSFTGSIDNVSVQELPASIDRKYYLDTDGSDDWMEVKPTLNLGEQWWHVGAWKSDTSGKYVFATTLSFQGGLRHASGLWKWRNAADTGLETLINFDPTTLQVVTVEQAGTNSISGRANGANSAGVITPYDDSGDTQGLVLFSSENDRFNGGLDGRFYGGSWGQEALDSDQREITEAYIASLARITLP